eukprot:GHVL01015950.1.p1 GENE.GHVL01015950.1~~GHVL01015950.1.p1  ORF type:complete len:114 (-),score=2.50 GHVL01015950.1:36-377(-)
MRQVIFRDEYVIKKTHGDTDSFLAAVFDLSHKDFINSWTKHHIPKMYYSVCCSIPWVDKASFIFFNVPQGNAKPNVVNNLHRQCGLTAEPGKRVDLLAKHVKQLMIAKPNRAR